jgi:hypothetical protein
MLGLDIRRVLDDGTGQLGERLAGDVDALLLHLEGGFLGHRGVKAARRRSG